jgi:hypothetical protein
MEYNNPQPKPKITLTDMSQESRKISKIGAVIKSVCPPHVLPWPVFEGFQDPLRQLQNINVSPHRGHFEVGP